MLETVGKYSGFLMARSLLLGIKSNHLSCLVWYFTMGLHRLVRQPHIWEDL